MIRVFRTVETGFVLANQGAVVLLMMTMTGLVIANVITRYVFGFSLAWAEELSRYAMIWVTYLAAGLALREGRHVAFEYLQGLLPGLLLRLLRGAIGIAILVFLGYLAVLGWELSQLTWRQTTAMLQWPRGLVSLAVPIGAVVMGLHLLLIFKEFVTKDVKESPEDVVEQRAQRLS